MSCDSVSAFAMRLFSGLQLCHAICSGVTTRCPLHALLLRPASDPAPELPGAQRPVGPELGQPGQQRHQQHRPAHPQRPDPAAPVPAPGVSPHSPGSSGVEVQRPRSQSGVSSSEPHACAGTLGPGSYVLCGGSHPSKHARRVASVLVDHRVGCLLTW